MMELLLPLGLLGLLGIVALIIIYIIKPNYQTKYVSSTYIWKLSLKYKKKRLLTSTLRNILLFLCQVLILTAIACILAKPAIVYANDIDENEVVVIIDSSTSMHTEFDDTTRFERAVNGAIESCNRVIASGGHASVIIADANPSFLRQRVTVSGRSDLIAALESLTEDANACSFGTSDMDAAMRLSEEVLAENPAAKIEVYTDKSFQYVPENISVISVREEGEWNVAILDAQTTLTDGYYELTVQIASYGNDRNVRLNVEVDGANAIDAETGGHDITLTRTVFCDADRTKTIIFRYRNGTEADDFADTEDIFYVDLGMEQRFYTYRAIEVYVDENDDLLLDNTFWVYGGLKEVVKVQYASGGMGSVGANPFVNNALAVLVNAFSDRWDIKITEVQQGADAALSGFDVYIFEHEMPKELPTDGVVILFDPNSAPIGSDITLRRRDYSGSLVAENSDHPLLRNISAEKIQMYGFYEVNHSNDYEVLMSCSGVPVMLARNDRNVKTVILTFSVHYSNLVMLPEWFILMYNIFDYFLPSTVVGNTFEVNEKITVNGRGESVVFSGAEEPIQEFPTTLSLPIPGKYTFDVETYFGKRAQTESIFVRTPKIGSNIYLELDSLADPYAEKEVTQKFDDLLVYFAAALVALLFIEWWLHSREKI